MRRAPNLSSPHATCGRLARRSSPRLRPSPSAPRPLWLWLWLSMSLSMSMSMSMWMSMSMSMSMALALTLAMALAVALAMALAPVLALSRPRRPSLSPSSLPSSAPSPARALAFALALLPTLAAPSTARADEAVSMFDELSYRSLVAEAKAYRTGDVLTVLIQENASATSSADSRAQRNTALQGTVGSSSTGLHTGRASVGTDSDGGGRTQRSGRLLATLSVRVVEVDPRGDLRVEGRQELRINGEVQAITLSGLVRPRDIAENNTVPSSRVAEARVEFDGEGFVSDKSKPGWIARLLAALGL